MYEKEYIINSENSICKGKIYKAKINNFINAKGEYINQIRMVPLKRKSCPGCQYCSNLIDNLLEISDMYETSDILSNIEHGRLYSLTIVNQTRDFETGIIDDWDVEFVEINEIDEI